MNIQSLIYFASAAKHLSFTKSAEECFIAQTAMSRQIAAIEAELGVKLFFRSRVKMQLTNAGKAFYIEAQDILRRYNNAVFQARDIDSGYNETLSIGFGLFDTQIVPEHVRSFIKQFPNVSILLNQYPYDVLIQNLEDSKCDIAFCPKNRTEHLKGVSIIEVKSYRQSVAVSSSHQIANKSEITPDDLDDQVFINPSEDCATHPIIFGLFCEKVGITPKKSVSANTLDAMLMMVEAGVGISIVPEYLKGTTHYDISVIPLKIINEQREHVVVSLASNNNKAIKSFMKMIGDYAQDTVSHK